MSEADVALKREVFTDMRLTFKNVETVHGVFADLTERVDIAIGYVPAMSEADVAFKREVFTDMRPSFKNVETVHGVFADLTEEDQQKLGGAFSLPYAGPMSASADETVLDNLVFSCGDRTCPCQSTNRYTLQHLMPTMVGPVKKDLCFDAFNRQMGEKITKEAFAIGVATVRAGEKYAVQVLAALSAF